MYLYYFQVFKDGICSSAVICSLLRFERKCFSLKAHEKNLIPFHLQYGMLPFTILFRICLS